MYFGLLHEKSASQNFGLVLLSLTVTLLNNIILSQKSIIFSKNNLLSTRLRRSIITFINLNTN